MAYSLLQQLQILQPGLDQVFQSKGSDSQFGLGDFLLNVIGYMGYPGVNKAISNLASGGSIGSAPNTVDQAGLFLINQTTASQVISFPNPSNVAIQRQATMVNVGSQPFTTAGGVTVAAGAAHNQLWNGSAWVDIS